MNECLVPLDWKCDIGKGKSKNACVLNYAVTDTGKLYVCVFLSDVDEHCISVGYDDP